jgi:hypothetical protein
MNHYENIISPVQRMRDFYPVMAVRHGYTKICGPLPIFGYQEYEAPLIES